LAVLGAMLTGKPVKFTWDRAEEMQAGAPRGAERWRIKDGVMNDGRIIAREFTGLFDSGAYTRLSSYGVVKGTAHLPGPYTIPNIAANVYCVFTNRTPSTAMRGFGITGVDFSIECHMDKVAETVGMDPIELRILNAYRDGDMKAHRRAAKNTALIECCQVAAQKAGIALPSEYVAMSSVIGGGVGERGAIPPTLIDEEGKIGERKRGAAISLAPSQNGRLSGRPDTVIPEHGPTQAMGERAAETPPIGSQRSDYSAPPVEPKAEPYRAPPTAPSAPIHTASPPSSAPTPPPTPQPPQAQQRSAFARATGVSTASQPPRDEPAAPPPVPEPQPSSANDEGYQPSQPFTRGVRRPGSSPFTSGTRRR
ncbi:MAG: molybdopterin cofactor-binding domain-containing protein, partial [Pseudomonadota bacterium]